MGTPVKVCTLSKLAVGTAQVVQANGQNVAIYNVDGKVYATANACPHRGASLGEGLLEGQFITCPRHGWQFDVANGALSNNAAVTVATYPVQVVDDDISVEI